MKHITASQKCECHLIIHSAMLSAGGVGGGLAQVPVADHVALNLAQSGMILALGKVFGVEISKSMADMTSSCLAATALGQTTVKLAIGWLPSAGNVICGVTAAGITEALGWSLVNEYARMKRSGESFNPMNVIRAFEKAYPKAKKMFT